MHYPYSVFLVTRVQVQCTLTSRGFLRSSGRVGLFSKLPATRPQTRFEKLERRHAGERKRLWGLLSTGSQGDRDREDRESKRERKSIFLITSGSVSASARRLGSSTLVFSFSSNAGRVRVLGTSSRDNDVDGGFLLLLSAPFRQPRDSNRAFSTPPFRSPLPAVFSPSSFPSPPRLLNFPRFRRKDSAATLTAALPERDK